MSIKNILKVIQKELDREFPKVNYGGCCVVASEMGKYLQKHYQTRVAVCDHGENSMSLHEMYDNMLDPNDCRSWWNMGVTFYHVVLEVKINSRWWVFDSEHFMLASEFWKRQKAVYGLNRYKGFITIENAVELSNNGNHAWNATFYNEKNVVRVRKSIAKKFSNVTINS